MFVALDQELHREVALKQIVDKHADDPASRARFLLEAEVTGGLEHPGIVPVYGLGTYADGRPFYAMRGLSRATRLREAIDRFHADGATAEDAGRRPLELRKLHRRFLEVCNAIDYAHGRGVLHRDIKPRNIVVGKHGETLVVDWGLAKATGRSDPSAGERTLVPRGSGSSSETLPGSALGTPGYMSPEQARGDLDRLGPHSDVYSLGATLYCLLTGRAPFEGDDLGEVLGRVEAGDFPPPHRLDPSIDAALEAVCLKAMALRPADRHGSARALAEDVERWMADEPVSAWAEPWSRKFSRWLSRHRTGVTAAAAAVLAGVVGLSAVLAVQSAANTRLSASLERETQANAELARSRAAVQARYELAAEAVKAFHTGVSEDFLLKEDRFKGLRDRLLKSAAEFYNKLGALLGRETDAASRRALARSNFELAELTNKIGRKQDALAMHRVVLAAREAMAARPVQRTSGRRSTSAEPFRPEVASLLNTTGQGAESLDMFRRSESLLAGLAASDPSGRAALAACRTRMGMQLIYAGKFPEALSALKRARADQEALAAIPGASTEARRELAETLAMTGYLLWTSGWPAEAEPEFRGTLAIYRTLAEEDPADIESRRGRASGRFYLGNVLSSLGRPDEAEAEQRAALNESEALLRENPAVNRLRRTACVQRLYLASLLVWRGGAEQGGRPRPRGSPATCWKLVDDDPGVAENRSLPVAVPIETLGVLLLQAGRPAEAEIECRSAVERHQGLVDVNPSLTIYRDRLNQDLVVFGDVVRALGQTARAKSLYERAAALTELAIRAHPTDVAYRSFQVGELRRRGLALKDLGDLGAAAADIRRALALCDGLPRRSGHEFATASCHAALAGLAGRAGSTVSAAEGDGAVTTAMEWLRLAVAMGCRNVNELRVDPSFDPLRSRADFRLLMMDMMFPADPFARGR